MVASHIFFSQFQNRYGEAWEFQYNRITRKGVLRGSDVDWQEYQVLDGEAPGLNLNDEEIRWLRNAWEEAIGAS